MTGIVVMAAASAVVCLLAWAVSGSQYRYEREENRLLLLVFGGLLVLNVVLRVAGGPSVGPPDDGCVPYAHYVMC